MTDMSRDEQLEAILDEVNHEEPAWAVIRVHLRVESELWRLAQDRLPFAEVLPTRVPCEALARWVVAAGLLDPELLPSLLALNGIRNKVAHQIDAELSQDRCETFVSKCPTYFMAHQQPAGMFKFRVALAQVFLAVKNTT